MANDLSRTMTLDKAKEILKSGIHGNYSYADFEQAIKIVRELDPDSELLKKFLFEKESYLAENNLTENQADVYQENIAVLDNAAAEYSFEDMLKSEDNQEIAQYINRTEITETNGESTKVLENKDKNSYLNLLFEASKLKAQTYLAGDPSLQNGSKNPDFNVAQTFKNEVKNIFFIDFTKSVLAGSIKAPKGKEQQIGSKEYRDYIEHQFIKATKTFNRMINSGKKISLHVDSILSSCADSSQKVENYIKTLRQKAERDLYDAAQKAQAGLKNTARKAGRSLSANAEKAIAGLKQTASVTEDQFAKLADSLENKKLKFETLCNQVSKNRYQIFKNIKNNFSDNKIKVIGNITANAGFGLYTALSAGTLAAGAAAAPVLVPAIGAYAAYHAVGSWVYPLIAEMRKINRENKEMGKPKLGLKAAWKQAWKNKMSNPKKKRQYIVSGAVNTILAGAGFVFLKNGVEAMDAARDLAQGTLRGANLTIAESIASTRHAISLGRSGMVTAAQLTDAGTAYTMSLLDPSASGKKELRNDAKSTAFAAIAGGVISGVCQYVGFGAGHHHANVETNLAAENDLTAGFSGKMAKDSISNKFSISKWFSHGSTADSTNVQGGATQNLDSLTTVPTDVTPSEPRFSAETSNSVIENGLFPNQYNPEMGISERQYNVLVNTTEGTLKAATGDEITLDRAYMNLDGVMDQFPGKTKEEVIYKFNRLYAFMRKAYEVGDGTLRETPSGAAYLEGRISSLSISGLDKDKLSELVDFAQTHTYDAKSDLVEGLNKLFPEGLDQKTLTSLVTTIHSNQRFNQYSQEMEALINLLGCGDKVSVAQYSEKINALLDNTDSLLSTGKAKTVLTGLSLAKDCHDDDGEWRHVIKEVVEAPKDNKPVEIPLINHDLKIIPHEAHINTDLPPFDENTETIPLIQRAPVKPVTEPVVPAPAPAHEPQVRKVTTPRYSDLTNGGGDKQEVLTGGKRRRWLRKGGYGE